MGRDRMGQGGTGRGRVGRDRSSCRTKQRKTESSERIQKTIGRFGSDEERFKRGRGRVCNGVGD